MRSSAFIVKSSASTVAVGLLVAFVFSGDPIREARSDVQAMSTAAASFLASLDAEQRASASFAFDADERLRWHFIPSEMFPRQGAMIRDMNATQRERAHALLRAALSQRGYMTATQIMELEGVLRDLENGGRFARDPEEYHVTVFGRPGGTDPWAWRFEGHHISLNFTVVDGSVAVGSPAFVGSNPAEVREGPLRGRRVLAQREDAARALLNALSADQRRAATIAAEAPRDILTGADVDISPFELEGVAYSTLSAMQQRLLVQLIQAYTGMMADDIAERRLRLIREGGLDGIHFAWAGGYERGDPHYYRVQGPSFLIEYDNTQNDANHVHAVWRDYDGDFGRDLLRDHLEQHPH